MSVLVFLICFIASAIGGICGIGGGVIIKPMLDAFDIMSVSTISFLSGLTVLFMAAISVLRQRGNHLVELRIGSLLAAGSVIGGILGNTLFQSIKSVSGQDILVGELQAIVLAAITLITLLYSVFFRNHLHTYHVTNSALCIALGGVMGVLSSFLGIGGGPINLAVLYFAFSMDTKKAAANSLYIIMFSQAASFVITCVKGTIPEFQWQYLAIMITAGMLGGFLGAAVNKRISARTTDKLFAGLLAIIVVICIYNACRFEASLQAQ